MHRSCFKKLLISTKHNKIVLFLSALFALNIALAQTVTTTQTVSPASTATCVVSAQNRSAPIDAKGNYVLYNLPGNGLIPFGTGASAQPFRVRATCDDGTVGETAMAFPEFEQRVIYSGDVVWGQNTPVPKSLQLVLPKSKLAQGESTNAAVAGTYPNGQTANLTARSTGTGYRSSSSAYVGVNENGGVFVQPNWIQNAVAWFFPLPDKILISAENDGVVASKVVSLKSQQRIAGAVLQSDGLSAGAGIAIYAKPTNGRQTLTTTTDAQGRFEFSELPYGQVCLQLFAVKSQPFQIAKRDAVCVNSAYQNVITADLKFALPASLQFQVITKEGVAVPNIKVSYADSIRSSLGIFEAPIATTDASGAAVFVDVPVGQVTPMVSVAGATISPSVVNLTAGQTQVVKIVLSGSLTTNLAALKGVITQSGGTSPVLGAVIELEEVGGLARRLSQVVNVDGKYRFDDLLASTRHNITVKQYGAVVAQDSVIIGGDGSETTRNISVASSLRIFGKIYRADGITAATDASIQINKKNQFGSWQFIRLATLDANGSFQFAGLGRELYKLDATAPDGAAVSIEVDLAGATSLSNERNLVFNAQSDNYLTKVSIVAKFENSVDLASRDGVAITVFNTACVPGCPLNALAENDKIWVTDFLPKGENTIVVSWMGQSQTVSAVVSAITTNQTLQRVANFNAGYQGVLSFGNQKTWLNFNANQGDKVDVFVSGLALGTTTAAYSIKTDLVDVNANEPLLTSGTGFDPTRVPAWSTGAIRSFTVPATGSYTLIVSPTYPEQVAYLGAYSLNVKVAAASATLTPWLANNKIFGGAVKGRVTTALGSPVGNQVVEISAGLPQAPFAERVLTDQNGDFYYDNVPANIASARAIREPLILATASSSLVNDSTATLNLILPRLAGRVLNGSGSPVYYAGVQLTTPQGNLFGTTYTNELGEYAFVSAPEGLAQRLKVTHPYTNAQVTSTVDIQQSEPTTVASDIKFAGLRGFVRKSSGLAYSYQRVTIGDPSNYLSIYTNTDGSYEYDGFVAGLINVAALNSATNNSVNTQATLILGTTTQVIDMVFPKLGTLSGKVRNSSGVAIPNAFVALYTASYMTACYQANRGVDTSYLSLMSDGIVTTRTDAAGNYLFEDLPDGQSFTQISAINTTRFCEEAVPRSVPSLQLGEDRQVSDLVYQDRTGTLGSLAVKVVNGLGAHLELPANLVNQCPLTVRLYSSTYGAVATDTYIHNVSGYRYADVPYGTYYADVSTNCLEDTFTSASVVVASATEQILPVVVPMVAGKVTELSGAPVSYPSVTLVQDKGIDEPAAVFYGRSDGQGNYIVVNSKLGTGSYTLTASGGSLNLSKSLTGTFITTPFLTQDIQLPGASAISGRVLTSSGGPPGFGYLRIVNPALPGWEKFDYMYAGNLNNNLRLPFGKNTIYFAAQDPAFDSAYSYASVDVQINNNFDAVALGDIFLLPFGTLEVSTLNQAGSAIEGNQGVRVYSAQMDPYFTDAFDIKVSDSNGKAQFILPAMPYSVVLAPNTRAPAGFVPVSITGGNTATVSVARSGSLQLNWSYIEGLLTDNGVSFMLTERGTLRTGSDSTTGYYYFNSAEPALLVDSLELPDNITAQWMTSDRELQVGPYYKGKTLKVTRRMYVPLVGGYARLMDSFTNLGTQTVIVSATDTSPNRGSSRVMVPSAALTSHIIYEANFQINGDYVNEPVLFGVVYGDNISLRPEVLPYANSDLLKWTISVPAGQTVSILKFHILKDIDTTSAQNKANQIVNKSMTSMFEGLSATDKINVKNFTIQP
jgi:hypothetical protein